MKKATIFFCILLFTTLWMYSDAQSVNGPVTTMTPISSPSNVPPTDSIEERLVSIALNGPQINISKHQNMINQYQLKAAQNIWTNLLVISINYNDQSFAKQNPNNTYVYPKYYFGLNIPVGTLLSRTSVKSAREQIQIGNETQIELKRKIRVNVISKYKQYKNDGELIELENEVVVNFQARVNKIESKVNDASFSIEEYNDALKKLNYEKSLLLNLQLQRDQAKLELEDMIGEPLEIALS